MKPEDRSKIRSFIGEIDGLKSREPEEKKFKDWKEKVEKKLEEVFGKGSDQVTRFQRVKYFDFSGGRRQKDQPLSESERRDYIAGLDAAKRLLGNFS